MAIAARNIGALAMERYVVKSGSFVHGIIVVMTCRLFDKSNVILPKVPLPLFAYRWSFEYQVHCFFSPIWVNAVRLNSKVS